jgi:large subunit ribosomal protein L18e
MKKDNPDVSETIQFLLDAAKKNNANIWRDIAKRLKKSSRNWAEVNVGKLMRYIQEGEIALVPGKVLGGGEVGKIEVAAWRFSKQARMKIEQAKGKCHSLNEIVKKNPSGKNIRIFGG